MSGLALHLPGTGFLVRIARDTGGNTLALLAAAILPLLGLVGGGVDMGRAYLAESRLQQACDAGVLAARKRLGATAPVTGSIPADVATIGNRFFNINYRSGIYGTDKRQFRMALDSDYAITGTATVEVPTTIMAIFGFDRVPIAVECESNLSFNALDVMLVLDVTGSMRHTHAGDAMSRMDSMKQVIRYVHAELETSKAPGAQVRYGFVPYATNVNVGHLLLDEWVTQSWEYQSREDSGRDKVEAQKVTLENWQAKSGTRTPWTLHSTYAATYVPPTRADEVGSFTCNGTQPADSWAYSDVKKGTTVRVKLEPKGIETIEKMERTQNGARFQTVVKGANCEVQTSTDTNYVETYDKITFIPSFDNTIWDYQPVEYDMLNWRSKTAGCIEERSTYTITDYASVDLSRAIDLDIDRVPDPGDPDTQWRPHYPDHIYVREIMPDGSGSISVKPASSTEDFADTGNWWFSDCPTGKAQKLAPMTGDELNTYLDTLVPYGATYHDIGMIWGARLLSPTGLFAAENAPSGEPDKNRNLIFLTDGQTEPYDLAYGAYGVDALDQRRWNPSGTTTLATHIEQRFKVACIEAKKRNITVWVIAFGTTVNQAMVDCAGDGRYFAAGNAVELNKVFSTIARSMADLRLTD